MGCPPAGAVTGGDGGVAGQRPAEAEVAGINDHIGRRTAGRTTGRTGRAGRRHRCVKLLQLCLDRRFLSLNLFTVGFVIGLHGLQVLHGRLTLGVGRLQAFPGGLLVGPFEDQLFLVLLDLGQSRLDFRLGCFFFILLGLLLLLLGAELFHQLLVRFGNRLHQLDIGDKIGKAVGRKEHCQRRSLPRLVKGDHPLFKQRVGFINLDLFGGNLFFQGTDFRLEGVDLGVFLFDLVLQGVNLLVHQRNLLLIKGNLFGELGLVGLLLVDLALEVGNFAVDIVQLRLDGVLVGLDLRDRTGGNRLRVGSRPGKGGAQTDSRGNNRREDTLKTETV